MAKIRTDQHVNLPLLHKLAKDHSRRNPRSLGVPNVNLFEIDRLTDFYFLGDCQLVANLCEYYMGSPQLFDDTHKDYFYKFSHFLMGREFLPPNSHMKLFNFRQEINNIAIWTEAFYPLDSRLFDDFYWRGRKVNNKLNGWVRWFFVLHSKSSSKIFFRTFGNIIQISIVRSVKRPFIKVFSALAYRRQRVLYLKSES